MDTVYSLLSSVKDNWKIILSVVVAAVVGFLLYKRFWKRTAGFANLGDECNPQIENSCGKGAVCQSDESGAKGVCFPLPEEEATAAKQEVAEIAEQAEEEGSAMGASVEGEEESSS